ncbi:hypothetical protein [Streptomyces sp. 6N223]|uniref:hypothetical protein n=1 Tax=Streptomyces sp. 6N223 TaxID=3457412 RepID=UPI003FD42B13
MSSPTTPMHAKLPWPKGTLVVDTETGLRGHLIAVVTERLKKTDRVVSETAFVRPEGGGVEWSAHLERIKPVETHAACQRPTDPNETA